MTSSLTSDPQTYFQEPDSENSIIKLKLKKPKSWNWELSTSKSSPNINFPKILLYDHKNNLLAETNQSDCIINDKKANKSTNDKLGKSNKISSSSSTASNRNETKRPPKTIVNSNGTTHNNIDSEQNHPAQLRNECLPHQSQIETNATDGALPLKNLGSRKRSLSVSFNEMKHFLSNLKQQLNSSGIDCKITNHHSNERKHLNRISSTNEHKHLNGKFNENQLRRIKSISDVYQAATKGSKQNLPETMYGERMGEKGPLRKSFKGKDSTDGEMLSSCRTLSNFANFDEHELTTTTEAVNGADIFKNNVYLSGNQTTLNRNNFSLKKSKSSMEVISSGVDTQRNEKKKYRRAHSTNSLRFSSSILERISEFKCRSSSTESEEIGNQCSNSTEHTSPKPKYFLRTSQAGTLLLLCNDSFNKNKKIRRRPRSYSKINGNDENNVSGRSVNDKIELKEQSDTHKNGDDTHFNTNGMCKGALQEEELYNENVDKCSNRYETAIANIDDLIAKVVSSKRIESMNGNTKCEENISINKKRCCCNDKIPTIDEHRIENKFYKNESVENLIENRDNELDKCINFSDSAGCEIVKEKRKKRAKSLGKNGFLADKCKTDSCEKVLKFSNEKLRCRSASVGSERNSFSSSDDEDYSHKSPRGRSRVKRRPKREKCNQGKTFHLLFNIKKFG